MAKETKLGVRCILSIFLIFFPLSFSYFSPFLSFFFFLSSFFSLRSPFLYVFYPFLFFPLRRYWPMIISLTFPHCNKKKVTSAPKILEFVWDWTCGIDQSGVNNIFLAYRLNDLPIFTLSWGSFPATKSLLHLGLSAIIFTVNLEYFICFLFRL